MEKLTPFLWFEAGEARKAAEFYVTLLPDSQILTVIDAPADNPSTPKGDPLVIEFTLAGRKFAALNGGPMFKHSEAFSMQVICEDQAEVDRLWDAITSDGGEESQCGWCKDRWGVSWQIVPKRFMELMGTGTPAQKEAVMEAIMPTQKLDIALINKAAASAAG